MKYLRTTESWLLVAMLGVPLWAQATSITIEAPTLPTTFLQANARMNFSEAALDGLSIINTSVSAAGQASKVGAGVFNLPVTSATVKNTTEVGMKPGYWVPGTLITNWPIPIYTPSVWVPPLPTIKNTTEAVAGSAMGSALVFNNSKTKKRLDLGDLNIDFQAGTINGDIWVNGQLTGYGSLFSFTGGKELAVGFNALPPSITMNGHLSDLQFTEFGMNNFATALGLRPFEKSALTGMLVGSLDVSVTTLLRKGINANDYIAAVPEPSTWVILAMGLVGIACVRRRVTGITS